MSVMPSTPAELSPTSALLLQGGDDRIGLLDGQAFNKYGCRPYPVAACIDFGSSTASHISAESFSLLESHQRRLSAAVAASSAEQVYAQELQRLRAQFLSLWGLQRDATELIFAASGTDAHLIAARLAETLHGASVSTISTVMIQCEETGSGVAAALRGQPFSSRTATGRIAPGAAQSAGAGGSITHIDVRGPDGSARASADVDADFEQAANRILHQGLPALVVAVDVSKTGIAAPSFTALAAMKARWGRQLTVLIDACQFRIDAAALRAYLDLGCMVAVTGSKFYAAPSFCGALLVPAELARARQTLQMPPLLQSYSSCAEWPPAWQGAAELAAIPNMGLLLRWEAALHAMQDFLQMPSPAAHRIMSTCASAIRRLLSDDPHFQLLDNDAAASAQTPPASIHTFIPCRLTPHRQALDRPDIERLYRRLQSTLQADGRMYLLGQPVQCKGAGQHSSWALRLCLSAPMIVTAHRAGDVGVAALIAQAGACLAAVTATIDGLS